MKYTLSAVVNGREVSFRKKFPSRNAALNKVFTVLDFDSQVERIIERQGNKHDLEYVCNNNSRFFISRIPA